MMKWKHTGVGGAHTLVGKDNIKGKCRHRSRLVTSSRTPQFFCLAHRVRGTRGLAWDRNSQRKQGRS